jgi:MotA/TolQ/ExbB proton channel family
LVGRRLNADPDQVSRFAPPDVIASTFVCAFVYSYVEAYRLRREWIGINGMNDPIAKSLAPRSDAERLGLSILTHASPETIRIKDLVDSYYSTHEVPLRTLSVISGLMVTLGLIGTILGLIISIGGLETVMTQVEGLSQGIFGGIKETIRGMAIAFYSTLFGAVLGAVVLRLLSVRGVYS